MSRIGSSPSRPSAVDDHHASGGKAAGGACQVDGGTLDLFEFRPAAHGRGPHNIGLDVWTIGYGFVHLGQERSGANGIAGDVPGSKLKSHRAS
jgi:hypothetical protein